MERLRYPQWGIVPRPEQCEAWPYRSHVVQLRTETVGVYVGRNEQHVLDLGPNAASYRSRAQGFEREIAPHRVTQDGHFLDVRSSGDRIEHLRKCISRLR